MGTTITKKWLVQHYIETKNKRLRCISYWADTLKKAKERYFNYKSKGKIFYKEIYEYSWERTKDKPGQKTTVTIIQEESL